MLLALIAYVVASGIVLLWTPLDSSRAPQISTPETTHLAVVDVENAASREWAAAMLQRFTARLLRRATAASRGTGQRASRIYEASRDYQAGPSDKDHRPPTLYDPRSATDLVAQPDRAVLS